MLNTLKPLSGPDFITMLDSDEKKFMYLRPPRRLIIGRAQKFKYATGLVQRLFARIGDEFAAGDMFVGDDKFEA
jgi:hypothetical protein